MNEPQETYKIPHKEVFKRLVKYAFYYKRILTFAFIALGCTTAFEILSPILVKIFLDDYLMPRNIEIEPITILLVGYVLVLVGKVICAYFQIYFFQELAMKIIQRMRLDVYRRVVHLPMKYFTKVPNGTVVSKVTNDTESILDFYIQVLGAIIQNGIMMIGTLSAMLYLDMKLGLLYLCILPLIFILIYFYRKYSSIYYHSMREQLSKLNAKINENIQGMEVLQAFRQERRVQKEFEEINQKHYQAAMSNVRVDSILLRPAVDFIYSLAIMIILSYFGFTSLNGAIQIGVLFAFVSYLERFFEPLITLMVRLSIFQQAMVSGSRIFDLLDEEIDLKNQKLPNEATHSLQTGEIQFQNVSFSYEENNPILKNISFEASTNETIAFVGHTGSGKSTIMNLLLRFYEPDQGEIYLGGESLSEQPYGVLRSNVGLVLQDPYIFTGTVLHNIRMFNTTITREQAIEAAKSVQAHEFIMELPNGYDTELTERGSTLSSGQRQLLSFARILAMNPKVLVLDEATSSIDSETEEKIQYALDVLREGRTTLIIAHRLSTIQDANQIHVLHKGKIIESGNHQQLLQNKRLYYKMYRLQNHLTEEAVK